MAIGTDQGCSVRLPASWNGLVGLKPTWGLVPYTGAASIEPTVDHIGPITKTVHDCAVLLQVRKNKAQNIVANSSMKFDINDGFLSIVNKPKIPFTWKFGFILLILFEFLLIN